jgi:hypothetical protein
MQHEASARTLGDLGAEEDDVTDGAEEAGRGDEGKTDAELVAAVGADEGDKEAGNVAVGPDQGQKRRAEAMGRTAGR